MFFTFRASRFNFERGRCNFCFHPRIFSRICRNEEKKKRKNRNQTNVENIIYFRLHDLSSSKWIDPPHTHSLSSPSLHTQDETEWNGRVRAIEKTDKRTKAALRCNGELSANFPFERRASLRTEFSKFEREKRKENGLCIHRNLSSRITTRVTERKSGRRKSGF